MGYLRKYLQGVGLVSALLIGEVLGGLMAPLPSDAAGTVKPPELMLQVDGLPTTIAAGATLPGTSILGSPVACNDTAYTACYTINTNVTVVGNGRTYRVVQATGATARLRVGDFKGQDNFSLIGVRFVPTVTTFGTPAANTTEQHILTITMKNKFNGALNVNNATGTIVGTAPPVGKAAYGMRSGGEFHSVPLSTPIPTTSLFCTTGTATARCNTVGDKVEFTGKGIFSGTTAVDILSPGAPTASNSLPLSLTVGTGSANTSIVNYAGSSNATLGQVNPAYPQFTCVDPAFPTTCQPEITLTTKVTLKGPDAFVLVNGGDGFCAICNAVDNSQITRLVTKLTKARDFLIVLERFRPSAFLRAIIARINTFLSNFNTTTDPTCPEGAKYIETISNLNELIDQTAFVASGSQPADIAPPSTITITKNTGQGTSATFDFDITGPSSSTESISMGGQNSKTVVVTVDAGTYNITENPLSGWTLNGSSCGVEGATTNVDVPVGGNVNCTFNNNKTFSSDDYRVIDSPGVTWAAARTAALSLGSGWDLATITSATEQNFIQSLLPPLSQFIGTTHDYWIAGEQPSDSEEPGGNWRWATDSVVFYNNEAIGYANWGTAPPGPANEPNNLGVVESNVENHVTLDNRYSWGWNDLGGVAQGYVAKRFPAP